MRTAFALLLACLLMVIGCTSAEQAAESGVPEPAVEEPAETESAPTTTPPSTLDVESLSWERVPHDEAAFHPTDDARMKDVIAWESGFVAVGETNTRNITNDWGGDGAVWVSPDGVSWTLLPNEDRPLGGPQGQYIEAITAGGPGLVAVGLRFDDPDAAVGLAAAVWTSPDGASWSSVAYDETTFGSLFHDDPGESATWLKDVTAGGPGLVAVGNDAWRAAVWTSPDGVNWTRVSHDPATFGHGRSWETSSGIEHVVVGDSGLVALGELDGTAAVWTSPDGFTWSVHPGVHYHSAIGRSIDSVTATPQGFVGIGTEETIENACAEGAPGDCRVMVWTSPDGITWTRVPHDDVFGGGLDKQMGSDVTTFGDQIVAVGTSVWTSPDGYTWTRVYEDPAPMGDDEGSMTAVAANDTTIVIVGDDGASDASVVVWATTSEAVDPTPKATVPSTPSTEARWTIDQIDGEWWPGADVAARPGGGFVVATGGMGVFWTEDGEVWTDADPERMVRAHFQFSDYSEGYEAFEQPQRLAVVGDRIAVLDRDAARIWIGGLDGGAWEPIPIGDGPGASGKMAITSNEDVVFVIAEDGTYSSVDPEDGAVRTGVVPQGAQEGSFPMGLTAAWFEDRWVVARGPGESLVSEDLVEWEQGTLLEQPDDPMGITSLVAGDGTIIATGCRGWGPHPVVFSDDGIEWQWAPRELGSVRFNTLHAGAAYSDALGFVTLVDGGPDGGYPFLATSPDGRAWSVADVDLPGPYGEVVNIAASGNQVLLTVINWSGGPTGYALLLTLE